MHLNVTRNIKPLSNLSPIFGVAKKGVEKNWLTNTLVALG